MSNIDWMSVFEWSSLLKAFVVGGLICVIGQILIDKTKLTPARILVSFVTLGVILGGLGIYKYLVDFAGAGATVPLTGFGYNLAKGAIEGVSLGSVSDDGYLIDTSVKQASDSASKGVTDEASVSFAEAGSPSVIVGADEVEEDVLKRIKKQQQAGFLGGVSSSGASLLI